MISKSILLSSLNLDEIRKQSFCFNEYLAQLFWFFRPSSLGLIWTLNWHFNLLFCAQECWHQNIYNMLASFLFLVSISIIHFRTILFKECLRFCLHSFVLLSETCEQEIDFIRPCLNYNSCLSTSELTLLIL